MSQQNTKANSKASEKAKGSGSPIFQQLSQKLHDLFKPEEVEVTIEGTGHHKTYKIIKTNKG